MGAAARALVLLALLGAAFLFGAAPFLGPEPHTGLSRDLYAYFFPRFVHVGRTAAGGALPLWNPWELCGVPFLASGQTGALNPLVVLVFGLLPPGPALAVHLVLHFLLCGALLYGLARALGLGTAGASVAAVVWTFSPALTHSVYHPNRIAGLVWMPVVFWLGLRASGAGDAGRRSWPSPWRSRCAAATPSSRSTRRCFSASRWQPVSAHRAGTSAACGAGSPGWPWREPSGSWSRASRSCRRSRWSG